MGYLDLLEGILDWIGNIGNPEADLPFNIHPDVLEILIVIIPAVIFMLWWGLTHMKKGRVNEE